MKKKQHNQKLWDVCEMEKTSPTEQIATDKKVLGRRFEGGEEGNSL